LELQTLGPAGNFGTMAPKNSSASSGERLLLVAFLLLVGFTVARWVMSVWSHHQ